MLFSSSVPTSSVCFGGFQVVVVFKEILRYHCFNTPTPSTPFLWSDQNLHSARYVSLRLGFPNRKNPKPLYYAWSSHTASTGEFADLKHVILAHDANELRGKQVDVTERRGKLGALLEHHVHSENKGGKKTVKNPVNCSLKTLLLHHDLSQKGQQCRLISYALIAVLLL